MPSVRGFSAKAFTSAGLSEGTAAPIPGGAFLASKTIKARHNKNMFEVLKSTK